MKKLVSYSDVCRRMLALSLLMISILFVNTTFSQEVNAEEKFPNKPVLLIVPFGAGTSSDFFARSIQPFVEKHLGANIIIENYPGGNTIVGYTKAYTAQPDGYTLSIMNLPSILVTQVKFNPVYDPEKFTKIAGWANFASVLACHPDTFKDFNEFVATARKRKLSVAVPGGVWGTGWMEYVNIEKEIGVEFNKVPFTGNEGAIEVAGKHMDVVDASSQAILSLVQSGQLKPIVTLFETRDLLFPDVPTYYELGYKSRMFPVHRGVIGPPNMPENILKVLENAFLKAAVEPKYLELAKKMNIIVNPLASRDYAKEMKMHYQSVEPYFDQIKKQ